MITNPVLPGFNPDPCICRRGDDYYIAVSTFEWFPGIPVYHSKDLAHWELLTHILNDADTLELRGVPSSKGIWAPCITWCEDDSLFYLVYGVMRSMNARYFDIDNYLISASEITGPWSDPVYVHSAGFDASLFHDDDGRKWISSLEWETRDGYRKPGGICLVEYDPNKQSVIGYPKRISMGATKRGCLEAPHIYKHDGMYYLMCAEGGTGYYHSVTLSRSESITGPYESCPYGPVITSVPDDHDESNDTDHLKPHYYNPDAPLQKAGHGSLTETPYGVPYVAFHCSRPFVPELCCTLGRETAIQKMEWTDDGWLRMCNMSIHKSGRASDISVDNETQMCTSMSSPTDTCVDYYDNIVRTESPCLCVPDGGITDIRITDAGFRDDFDSSSLGIGYYAQRIDPASFCDLTSRPGWLRIRGQQSLSSADRSSLLARKLTGIHAEVTTKMDFEPEVYQHSAGLVIYYDNMNYVWLRKYWSETLGRPALSVTEVSQGNRDNHNELRVPAPEGDVWMKIIIEGRTFRMQWSSDGDAWNDMGYTFDTWKLSDEYSKWGEFTGTMVGMACTDAMYHSKYADFGFFKINIRTD